MIHQSSKAATYLGGSLRSPKKGIFKMIDHLMKESVVHLDSHIRGSGKDKAIAPHGCQISVVIWKADHYHLLWWFLGPSSLVFYVYLSEGKGSAIIDRNVHNVHNAHRFMLSLARCKSESAEKNVLKKSF